MRLYAVPLLIVISATAMPVQAKLYKWIDDNGQVHYSDTVPAQYLVKEHKEMSEQGLSVKKVDAAETEAERAERKRVELVKARKQQREEEKRRRDRILLDTYTTERDLVAARDARIEAVESQIQLADSIINDSIKKIEKSETLIASLKAQGRVVPETLYQKVDGERRQLETQREVRRTHEDKRKAVNTQFSDYILRFRELKAEQKRLRDQIEARNRPAVLENMPEDTATE
ncbi:MAG: DUF4124 domain-containing protein [Gammaproteobacteria bacterium]